MGIRVGPKTGRTGREPWLAPPRLRTAEEGDDRRHATWLELFFDLVFVAAIAELSYVLLADVTVGGFARYLGYFVPKLSPAHAIWTVHVARHAWVFSWVKLTAIGVIALVETLPTISV